MYSWTDSSVDIADSEDDVLVREHRVIDVAVMPITQTKFLNDPSYLNRVNCYQYQCPLRQLGDQANRASIPEGYEVYESPEGQVLLRKIVPQLVLPAEVAVVEDGSKRYAPGQNCIVDVQGKHIVIYHAEPIKLDIEGLSFGLLPLPTIYRSYTKVMRFALLDDKNRTFRVQRWSFEGSVDSWIDIWGPESEATLSDLVKRFCPSIGQESFFELM